MSVFTFWKKENNLPLKEKDKPLRVVVTSFADDCAVNSAEACLKVLKRCPYFDAIYDNAAFNPEILSLESRNFYDLVDKGRAILKRSKAQVLVWGYKKDNFLRLNFQTPRQYERTEPPSFSLLESLYLPLSYFQEGDFPVEAARLFCAVIMCAADGDFYPLKKKHLEQLLRFIEQDRPPDDLPFETMPYIQNMLAKIYLTAKQRVCESEVKTASSLLGQVLKNKNTAKDALLLGNVYANFGQLYYRAAKEAGNHRERFCRQAVEYLQYARKYFNKQAFPFDYGGQTFALSQLHFMLWQQTSDVQSLRDAVFDLRETEKIFSKTAFPFFWAEIENDLGAYLSILSTLTENEEILHKAVECFENRQEIYTKDFWPLVWAKAASDIGELYASFGKRLKDEAYLTQACACLEDAEEIYENAKRESERQKIQQRLKIIHDFLENRPRLPSK